MVDGDENFLSREEDKEGKLGLRRETKTGHEAMLVFSLVHCHTVNHTAVTLKKGSISNLHDFRLEEKRP